MIVKCLVSMNKKAQNEHKNILVIDSQLYCLLGFNDLWILIAFYVLDTRLDIFIV